MYLRLEWSCFLAHTNKIMDMSVIVFFILLGLVSSLLYVCFLAYRQYVRKRELLAKVDLPKDLDFSYEIVFVNGIKKDETQRIVDFQQFARTLSSAEKDSHVPVSGRVERAEGNV